MSDQQFSYRAFELNIRSTLRLPELAMGHVARSDESDVLFDFAFDLPQPDVIRDGRSLFEATPERFVLDLPAARYEVKDGKQILVRPAEGAAPEVVRLLLLQSPLAALLLQRGVLLLHSAAVANNGEAALLLGPTAQGKSALAAALYLRGWTLLADDFSAVVFSEGIPLVLPAYPRLAVWRDTTTALGLDIGRLERTRPEIEKYYLNANANFSRQPLPLKRLFILSNGPDFTVKPINGAEAIRALIEAGYQKQLLVALGQQSTAFRQAAELAAAIEISQLLRPVTPYNLWELAAFVEGAWES